MPVDDVVALLNDYLSAMTDVVFEHEGTIDKFIGDAIMTTFGVPVARGDDALRAVQTAIAMHAALAKFNEQHTASSATLSIGIGIHTGEVIAGNIGSDKRLDDTVIGNNVNLTSRKVESSKTVPGTADSRRLRGIRDSKHDRVILGRIAAIPRSRV